MLTAKLQAIGRAFAAVCPATHYRRPDRSKAPFMIWAETGEQTALQGGNIKRAQAISGTADYFTLTEFDPAVDQIQTAMNGQGMAWELNSVQYEEETGLIHYSWDWKVAVPVG